MIQIVTQKDQEVKPREMHTSSDSFLTSYQRFLKQNWMIIGLGIMLAAIILITQEEITALKRRNSELNIQLENFSYLEKGLEFLRLVHDYISLCKKS